MNDASDTALISVLLSWTMTAVTGAAESKGGLGGRPSMGRIDHKGKKDSRGKPPPTPLTLSLSPFFSPGQPRRAEINERCLPQLRLATLPPFPPSPPLARTQTRGHPYFSLRTAAQTRCAGRCFLWCGSAFPAARGGGGGGAGAGGRGETSAGRVSVEYKNRRAGLSFSLSRVVVFSCCLHTRGEFSSAVVITRHGCAACCQPPACHRLAVHDVCGALMMVGLVYACSRFVRLSLGQPFAGPLSAM